MVDINAVLTVRADAGGPYAGDEGAAIAFDASGSTDRDGTVVAWEWDLDLDGDFSDATGVTASRAFPDNGTFTIAVRVTDDSGEQDTDTAEVVVGNLPPVAEAGPDQNLTEGDAAILGRHDLYRSRCRRHPHRHHRLGRRHPRSTPAWSTRRRAPWPGVTTTPTTAPTQ